MSVRCMGFAKRETPIRRSNLDWLFNQHDWECGATAFGEIHS
jgi:hypothetical protein